jgi:hypothetical protein
VSPRGVRSEVAAEAVALEKDLRDVVLRLSPPEGGGRADVTEVARELVKLGWHR